LHFILIKWNILWNEILNQLEIHQFNILHFHFSQSIITIKFSYCILIIQTWWNYIQWTILETRAIRLWRRHAKSTKLSLSFIIDDWISFHWIGLGGICFTNKFDWFHFHFKWLIKAQQLLLFANHNTSLITVAEFICFSKQQTKKQTLN